MAAPVKQDQGAPKLGKTTTKTADPTNAETYADLTKPGKYKFWVSQIADREKDQKKFVKDGENAIKVYRTGTTGQSDSSLAKFNILSANVGVLMPATYSATPKPDVRRRFAQADELGRVTAEILERSLEYEHDQFDVDEMMEAAVLDMLLPGRGTARIMYEAETEEVSPGEQLQKLGPDAFQHPNGRILARGPDGKSWGFAPNAENPMFEPVDGEPEKYMPPNVSRGAPISEGEQAPEIESDPADTDEDVAEWYFGGTPYPHVVTERTWFEHVNWKDFLHGAGRIWQEVPWVGFRHLLTREQLRRLPISLEVANSVELDYDTRDDNPAARGKDTRQAEDDMPFKRGIVWELWFKETKQVIWIAPSVKTGPLFERDPDVKHQGFYPTPRPLLAIQNPDDLMPSPEYFVYKGLAEELNRAVRRLQKLVNALKVRGIYAGMNVDFERVFSADDNELIPSTDAKSMLSGPNGARSLDDLIWMVPLDTLITTVQQLYAYVVNVKETIYEITGISDIARGATNPNETLGAQQLKAQFGSIRVAQRQRDVQRFVRDLVRMEADVICQLFGEETLADITGYELPTPEQKAIWKQTKISQQNGQPPPNSLASLHDEAPHDVPLEVFLARPTWDEVMNVLRSNITRSHKVDIETDSTIATDMAQQQGAMTELLQGIVQFLNGVAPAVEAGILPVDAAKTILLSAVRRFGMGKEVEEALDMIGEQGVGAPGQGAQAGKGGAQTNQSNAVDVQRVQQEGQKDQADVALNARKVAVDEGTLSLKQQQFQADQADKAYDRQQRQQAIDQMGQRLSSLEEIVKPVQQGPRRPKGGGPSI